MLAGVVDGLADVNAASRIDFFAPEPGLEVERLAVSVSRFFDRRCLRFCRISSGPDSEYPGSESEC